MIEGQTTLFDFIYKPFKIDKPIRLIELFGGYGSQALALKYLGVNFEHWKLVEWAVKSIQAYKDIHFPDENVILMGFNRKEQIEYLYKLGISNDYNKPMTREQIERLSDKQLMTIVGNILITHNLVNIQNVKGEDLEIVDTDKYCYIMTYSFPCQDLSLAGKGKGMSDTSTRSGLLWEVERILTECKEKPQVLLMENVPQVHSVDNLKDFNKWKDRLEELGYKNYFQDLIATDYGIPQTRNRCFMVSILGDYNYTFPKPIPLKLKLKDMLEDNVDEKYYISDDLMQHILKTKEEHKEYTQYDRCNGDLEMWCRVWKDKSPTLNTKAKDTKIYVKNATTKGYLEASEGDGVNISSRMEYQRGNVQKDKIQTLDTMGGESKGVVVLKRELCNKLVQDGLVEEGDVVKHSYTQQIIDANKKCVEKNDGNMITLTTRGDCVGVCVNENNKVINPLKDKSGKSWQFEQQVYDENGSARTLKASEGSGNIPKVVNDLRIRKLTPKECFRLMGVKDEDFEKCKKNQSNASLYHLAGDSIVVNVLMAIFREML